MFLNDSLSIEVFIVPVASEENARKVAKTGKKLSMMWWAKPLKILSA